MPGTLGREIQNYWKSKNFKKGLVIGPRIVFTYSIVRENCPQANIQKTLKKQSYYFCKKVFLYSIIVLKTKNIERKNFKKFLSLIKIKKILGRIEHIRKGKRIVSILRNLVRVNVLVSFIEI